MSEWADLFPCPDEPCGFFIFKDCAGSLLWVVGALALLFWPWIK